MNTAGIQFPSRTRSLKPGLDSILFFAVLFSGPPKFRVREALASVQGDFDLAAMVQAVAALVAGCWIAYQLLLMRSGKRPRLHFALPQKLALWTILLLVISTSTSLSPALTIFKVYQLTVDFLFCVIFVQWYGIECFLEKLTVAFLLICLVIGVASLAMPELVLDVSESGASRLRGSGIADAGFCSAMAMILLFASKRRRPAFWIWLSIVGMILVASLTRNAWVAVAVFFLLAIWKYSKLQRIKLIYFLFSASILAPLVGGLEFLDRYRETETIFTLSDRLGLWAYMVDSVLQESPVLGLGYVAAPRILGLEYNPELGAAHSVFFEVFVGGGILTASVFLLLSGVLCIYAWRLLRKGCTQLEFSAAAAFLCLVIMGVVGGELDSTPFAFTFWGLAAALPLLQMGAVHAPTAQLRHSAIINKRPAQPQQI